MRAFRLFLYLDKETVAALDLHQMITFLYTF